LAIGLFSAAQAAVVLATPIPKYKMGRGPAEVAEVGDGGVLRLFLVLMVQVLNDT
jgi:hypothetical protein